MGDDHCRFHGTRTPTGIRIEMPRQDTREENLTRRLKKLEALPTDDAGLVPGSEGRLLD